MPLALNASTRLLFIGDSITDCGRMSDPEKLGGGYVRDVFHWLMARDPKTAPEILNFGISGNKIPDLQRRWSRDVLEQKPDVVSIKIGINDVWHGLMDRGDGCTIDDFTNGYRDLLTQLKEKHPGCALVLCEPSVIDPPQDARANEAIQPYARAVHELARSFQADALVPLHTAFVRARNARPDLAWTTDGVHPTPLGHILIAREWLKATGQL